MSCVVLDSLTAAAAAAEALPVLAGLGADVVLAEQVQALAGAVAVLQRTLAVRMAALEREGPPVTDVRGDAVRAGLPGRLAGGLRRLGQFAHQHQELAQSWAGGSASAEQVDIVRLGAGRLADPRLREELVAAVLEHLPNLDARATRQVVAGAVDRLQPGDPDQAELCDHAARELLWSRTPRGGIAFQGYLPAAEAEAFTAALAALRRQLRVAGDGLTGGQRNADALAALVARAGAARKAKRGRLPAVLTMTVPIDQAGRVALRDPAGFGSDYRARPRSGALFRGRRPAGDAAVRFGMCCADVAPVLVDDPPPGSLLGQLARTTLEPLAVGRAVRLATPAQRTALDLRDGGCAIPGCQMPDEDTEPHHVVGWAVDGGTDLQNLVSLCWVHHRLTELGKFVFLPRRPGEPRPAGALEHALWWIIPPRPDTRQATA